MLLAQYMIKLNSIISTAHICKYKNYVFFYKVCVHSYVLM